jgi:hypothetical protein
VWLLWDFVFKEEIILTAVCVLEIKMWNEEKRFG